ncbi:MAG TPA: hypothetical protein EYO81_03580 [Gammaproteobacteria bacterium]|nr:hypothetical protein [Gammaproteobacteria bacterium]
MKIWLLPCFLGILAILSANLVFLISAIEGHVETCFPYFEGCASISASGRHGLAAILFKLTILPVMTLLTIYWLISWNYLNKITSVSTVQNKFMLITGVIGSLFGILYTAFLGSEGDVYQLLRRFGIYVFFLGTFIAQILEIRLLSSSKEFESLNYLKGMKLITLLIGVFILISAPSYGFLENDDWFENVLEWNISFLLFFYFIASSLLWKKKDIKIDLLFNKS